jgi:hypothetical protein
MQQTGKARDDRKASEQARPRASFLSLHKLWARKNEIYSAIAGRALARSGRLRPASVGGLVIQAGAVGPAAGPLRHCGKRCSPYSPHVVPPSPTKKRPGLIEPCIPTLAAKPPAGRGAVAASLGRVLAGFDSRSI